MQGATVAFLALAAIVLAAAWRAWPAEDAAGAAEAAEPRASLGPKRPTPAPASPKIPTLSESSEKQERLPQKRARAEGFLVPRREWGPPPPDTDAIFTSRLAVAQPELRGARLFSAADVDPLVTGSLYSTAGHMRTVYLQRAPWGLAEFSSSGGVGDVGVDVGPYGLAEYGGRVIGADDGIPENWAFPSAPYRWYTPRRQDYYGPTGPTVPSSDMYALSEPDHDPPAGAADDWEAY